MLAFCLRGPLFSLALRVRLLTHKSQMHTWVAKYGGEDLLLRRILAPQVGAAVAISRLLLK